MTDNEIIKALEYCKDCSANLNVEIIDLINRQKAEIENAKAKIKICAEVIERQDTEIERLKKDKYKLQKALNQSEDYRVIAESEAYKDFAEHLKEEWFNNYYDSPDVDFDEFVDNLLKEIVDE